MRKIEVINFAPFDNNENAPSLTPDEMAACFARFSRNRQGIDSIWDSVKDQPKGKRVGSILKFNDYGHRSIMDMLIIPITLEGISMYAAARLFNFANQAAGQESSTRYISEDFDILPSSQTCTTTAQYMEAWKSFDMWKLAVAKIPSNATRKERNEVLDSVRYLLPAIATTNVAIIMSARAWEKTLTMFYSYPHEIQFGECCDIALGIKDAIDKTCGEYPMKHFGKNEAYEEKFKERLLGLQQVFEYCNSSEVTVWSDYSLLSGELSSNFVRKNRYDPWVDEFDEKIIRVCMVLTFAELRDLNRHRNRLVSAWTFLETNSPITLDNKCLLYYSCSLSQLLYEIEIRTSEGAHPSYQRLMNLVLNRLKEFFSKDAGGESTWNRVENNLFANSGIKDN